MAATLVILRWTIVTAIALLLLGVIGPLAQGPAASVAGSPAIGEGSVPTSCVIPIPASGVHGELTIEGGPLPASAAGGLVLNYTYTVAYRTVDEPNGTQVGVGCMEAYGNTTTEANGSFSFDPATPPSNCTKVEGGSVCTEYSFPFAPVNVTFADGPPRGYALSVAGWYTSIAVALVYELEDVTIVPGGPTVTTATGAPTGFTASAWAANGTPAPLETAFSWAVGGVGWSFDGTSEGASVDLTAVAGASVATLTVTANASDGGDGLGPVRASVEVVAIPTEIEIGETNRTSLDVGGVIGIHLAAVGAAGFTYSASVEPGLGLQSVAAPCLATPPDDGTVEVDCSANVTYSSAGTAQPTANVTNGYSSASWRFPNVVVSPPPALEVTPAAPVGYVLAPIDLTLAAANGSGTPPYAKACLEVGSTAPVCLASPGPAWTFTPTFARAGEYAATAWAFDADGTNATVSFSVGVVPPLTVGPIEVAEANATVGTPDVLNATVSGGDLPGQYWWNDSRSSTTVLGGDLASDGVVSVTVVPTDPGPMVVTLTVVDRLGTVEAGQLVLSVAPAPAGRVTPLTAPPPGPVIAGTPVPLSWEALGRSGAPDTEFAAAVELDLGDGNGTPDAWVNASGVGPLADLGSGEYEVPAAAWIDGVLSVSVTVGTATTVSVGLQGSTLPGAVSPMELVVTPDLAHLRFFAPDVVHAGERTNATLWRVGDRFGNPTPGAVLTIGLSFGSAQNDVVVVAVALPDGGSGVWINYTAPTTGAGEVTVVDAAGDAVLGPLSVPAASVAPPTDPAMEALAAAVPVGATSAVAFAAVRHRRRARTVRPAEDDLRRLAEGRSQAVELIGRAGEIDLAGLEAAWEPRPAPPALADWLASLVADGTLRAKIGDDGRARFCLAADPAPAARVVVDPQVLDRSLRRREEELREEPEDDRPASG